MASTREHMRYEGRRVSGSSMKLWPAERIATGVLTIRPKPSLRGGLAMVIHVQHGVLTLRPKNSSEGFGAVQVSTDALLIKVAPWHFDMFSLSCKIEEPSMSPLHEVFCYAADQTARNKWLAVFRRMGITIIATRLPPLMQSSGSCPDLDSFRQQCDVPLRHSTSCDSFWEVQSKAQIPSAQRSNPRR